MQYHISGQLKVAPEHVSDKVLDTMGKCNHALYEKFREKYLALNKEYGMNQFLVPYLMSSHPGCDLNDAIELACYLKSINHIPQQVQDFYPDPGDDFHDDVLDGTGSDDDETGLRRPGSA